ncbi:FkbM family methyltransferase [Salinibacter ruber]|uniref:FkbM family methyltransferase n=1 Tax=Salinibacter ruber TaxID=146919 RepID=UPI002073BED5|nr:FkbM family methyltransferase [Salinibacter ruber]MCS4044987.1 FkbM family methyltransferase [Salinibacter ruber]
MKNYDIIKVKKLEIKIRSKQITIEMKVGNIKQHSYLEKYINKNSVVLDLGSNKGEFSEEIVKKHGCKAYGIEANPNVIKNIENDKVQIHNIAISNKNGEISINIPKNGDASTTFHEKSDSVEVNCITIERFMEKKDIETVDLLKIDIEGEEIKVIKSSIDTLTSRVKQISVEYHDFMDESLKKDVKKVDKMITQNGFERMKFSTNNGDILYWNKEYIEVGKVEYAMAIIIYKYLRGMKRIIERWI